MHAVSVVENMQRNKGREMTSGRFASDGVSAQTLCFFLGGDLLGLGSLV